MNSQMLILASSYLELTWAAADGSDFANTLNAGSNRWYDPHTTNAYKMPNGVKVNFSGWKSAVGTGLHIELGRFVHITGKFLRDREPINCNLQRDSKVQRASKKLP